MSTQFCPYCMNPVEADAPCKNCGLTSGTYTPAPHHLPPGTILRDRYLIGRVLGEGGFGITYIGCDLQLELKVAIKEYFPTDKANRVSSSSLSVSNYSGSVGQRYEEGKIRFLQEARTMARMDKQPVIVSAKDFFEANNTAYIVMEYVEGTTLKELVNQKGGRIPVNELLDLMEPLFKALSTMHSMGLIHRDISPENLMLEQGVIRLLDFGCAREPADGNATLTIALKHGYAPIEQYQNKGQGPWTDVYALSATIYFCLTGKKPPQSMDRLCEDELILPRKLGIPLTENQEKALLCGMGIRPRKRFHSVEELRAALYNDDPVFPDFVLDVIPTSNDSSFTVENTVTVSTKTEGVTVTKADTPVEEEKLKKGKGSIIALVSIVLVLALVAVFLFIPGGEEEPGLADHSDVPVISLPEDVQYAPAYDAHELCELLEAEWVQAVTIPADAHMNTQELERINEIVLSKPLRIEAGATLVNYHGINIVEGGIVGIDGEFYTEGIVRTSGGKITVSESGRYENGGGFTWLRNREDLYSHEDAWVSLGTENVNYLVFNEEDAFANAVHVETIAQLDSALKKDSTKAIVIDKDMTLDYNNRYTEVPVIVSPGVTLTAKWSEIENQDASLCLGGAVLVNYGRFVGDVNTLHEENGPGAVINFGTAEASYFLANPRAVFVNLGEWYTGGGQSISGGFYNIGYFCGNSHSENVIGDGWTPFTNELTINTGVMDFLSDKDEARCDVEMAGNHTMKNSGIMNFYAGANLINRAYILNAGSILFDNPLVEENPGHFENQGIIEVLPNAKLNAIQVGMDLSGVVLHYGVNEQQLLLPDYVDRDNVISMGENAVANSAEELEALMADDSVSCIAINGELTVKEEFRVTKGLLCWGSLTVEGSERANLCIDGHGAYVVNANRLNVNGEVHVTNGGRLVGLAGELHCGDLLRAENANVSLRHYVELRPGGRIELDSDSRLTLLSDFNCEDAEIKLMGDSSITFAEHTGLAGTNVSVESGSFLHSIISLELDKGCSVVNDGNIFLSSHCGYPTDICGDFVNNGGITMWAEVQLRGDMVNNGFMQTQEKITIHGSLQNNGTLNTNYGAFIEGEVQGNPPCTTAEYRDYWA